MAPRQAAPKPTSAPARAKKKGKSARKPRASRAATTRATRKKRLILVAAAKIMHRRGYAETTVERIAEEAGTQAGSLYYHFESRDQIVEEVIQESMTRLTAAAEQCLENLPARAAGRDKIQAVMRAQIEVYCGGDEFMAAFRRVAYEIPQELRDRVNSVPRSFGQLWRDLLEQARSNGEIRGDLDLAVVRLLVIGSVVWTSRWYRPDGGKTPDEIATILATMFFDGMGTASG